MNNIRLVLLTRQTIIYHLKDKKIYLSKRKAVDSFSSIFCGSTLLTSVLLNHSLNSLLQPYEAYITPSTAPLIALCLTPLYLLAGLLTSFFHQRTIKKVLKEDLLELSFAQASKDYYYLLKKQMKSGILLLGVIFSVGFICFLGYLPPAVIVYGALLFALAPFFFVYMDLIGLAFLLRDLKNYRTYTNPYQKRFWEH